MNETLPNKVVVGSTLYRKIAGQYIAIGKVENIFVVEDGHYMFKLEKCSDSAFQRRLPSDTVYWK